MDAALAKPKLRGVSHEVAFFVSPVVWIVLLGAAPSPGARVAVAVYATAVTGLFGISALLHRRHGFPRWAVKPPLEAISPEMEDQVMAEFERES